MNRGRSPNPRPRQTRRMREEDAPGVQTPNVDSTQDTSQSAEDNAGQVPSQQASSAQSSNPTSDTAMLRQMFEFLATSQQQQQQQFTQLMQQQALFQQQMLQQQATTQRQQKRKGNPPMFNGETSDDLELWLFSTEQYYADSQTDMASDTSDFVNLIFGNLGPTAQTWFRDFKVSLGDRPATWTLFKQQIRERFRDSDFQYKLLSKLYNLRWTGSQQSYTSQFLHLLSQLDEDLPEGVKRWFFQQNLRTDTSAFVSQNIPDTLQRAIELAQRFEDSRPGATRNTKDEKLKGRNAGVGSTAFSERTKSNQGVTNTGSSVNRLSDAHAKPTCGYCDRIGHTESVCRKKKAAAERAAGSKNA